MDFNSISSLLFIIFVFAVLMVINFLIIGISNIEKDWPKHRCNPTIMPFADLFGHNSKENFIYCMQNIQGNYMSYLTMPFQYGLDLLTDVGSEINSSINSIRSMINYIQGAFGSIITNIFGVVFNLMVEIQRIIVGFKDMLSSLMGIIGTIMFIMEGTMHTFNSLWNGPAGQGVRFVANAIG